VPPLTAAPGTKFAPFWGERLVDVIHLLTMRRRRDGCTSLHSHPRNRALSHAVAAREFGKGRALRAPPPCFCLLRIGQFWFPAHVLPALLRPTTALGGAGADEITLHVGEAAKHGNHQPPGTGAGIGPWLGEGAELRLGVDDLLDDGEQVEGAPRARRSIRVTVTTSPGARPASILRSSRRSLCAPVTFSLYQSTPICGIPQARSDVTPNRYPDEVRPRE
jgi:hypothetical protein